MIFHSSKLFYLNVQSSNNVKRFYFQYKKTAASNLGEHKSLVKTPQRCLIKRIYNYFQRIVFYYSLVTRKNATKMYNYKNL